MPEGMTPVGLRTSRSAAQMSILNGLRGSTDPSDPAAAEGPVKHIFQVPELLPGDFLPVTKRTSFSCNDLQQLQDTGPLLDGQSPQHLLKGVNADKLAAAVIDEEEEENPDRSRRVLFSCHGSRGDVQPLVALALGLRAAGYDVAFWTVRPVNRFVESHGFRTILHDLDTDDMMRRVQIRVNQVVGRLGQGLGFFHTMVQVHRVFSLWPESPGDSSRSRQLARSPCLPPSSP